MRADAVPRRHACARASTSTRLKPCVGGSPAGELAGDGRRARSPARDDLGLGAIGLVRAVEEHGEPAARQDRRRATRRRRGRRARRRRRRGLRATSGRADSTADPGPRRGSRARGGLVGRLAGRGSRRCTCGGSSIAARRAPRPLCTAYVTLTMPGGGAAGTGVAGVPRSEGVRRSRGHGWHRRLQDGAARAPAGARRGTRCMSSRRTTPSGSSGCRRGRRSAVTP